MAKNCEDLLPILYTTTEPTSNEPKRCVVVMDRLRAVTFRHGEHKKFTQDQETKIYPIDPLAKPVNVKVVAINDSADFVVFHTIDKDFDVYPDAVDDAELDQSYKLIGINAKGRANVKGGVIRKRRVGFAIGDNHTEDGDPGAAIVDLRNWFIGMVVGNFVAPSNLFKDSTSNLDPAPKAAHLSYAKILSAQTILAVLPAEENEKLDEEPPCKLKKKYESDP